MKDLAKNIIFSGILLYFIIKFGQNVFDFGSDVRKDFYFIGMAGVQALFAWAFFLSYRSIFTTFWLWYTVGSILNEALFRGSLEYFEVYIAVTALALNFINRNKPNQSGERD